MQMTIEEMAELTKALCKIMRYDTAENVEAIREEIADVQIMLDQMKMIYGAVDDIEASKIERLRERIERNYV